MCMDTRLEDVSGSVDTARKFEELGHGWLALIFGDDWIMANELVRFVYERAQQSPAPATRAEMFSFVKTATTDFQSSPFCNQTHNVDLIAVGFIAGEPMLLYTGYSQGAPYTVLAGHMAAIGSGAAIALSLLKIRQYATFMSEKEAVYLAYEAKKYSENTPGVGPKTWLGVLQADGTAKTFAYQFYSALEESVYRFGLQPIVDPPDLQYSTTDPSPPQPSPESPGESDEF